MANETDRNSFDWLLDYCISLPGGPLAEMTFTVRNGRRD